MLYQYYFLLIFLSTLTCCINACQEQPEIPYEQRKPSAALQQLQKEGKLKTDYASRQRLEKAVNKNDLLTVWTLLEEGVYSQENIGPVWHAAYNGNPAMVRLLHNYGLPASLGIRAALRGDSTPTKKKAVVQALLDSGIRYDESHPQSELVDAANKDYVSIIAMLLDAGWPINQPEIYLKHTPLLKAVWADNYDATELLLQRGADITSRDHKGKTVFTLRSLLPCNRDPILHLLTSFNNSLRYVPACASLYISNFGQEKVLPNEIFINIFRWLVDAPAEATCIISRITNSAVVKSVLERKQKGSSV